MSKDHRSVGLRWSFLLRGSSFGGHGSFLGLFNSSFVFHMISCHIWSCGKRFCDGVYHDRWVIRRTSPLLTIMRPCDPLLTLGKSSSLLPWAPWWKEGEKRASRGSLFPFPFSGLFWRVSLSFLNYSNKFHIMADVGLGPSGPNCILVPINGPRSLLLVSCYRRSLGLTFSLGSQNQIWGFELDLILAEKMGLYTW